LKASGRENLEIQQPVACRDGTSFHFHPTVAGMLGTTLVGDQVVQMCQPSQKRSFTIEFLDRYKPREIERCGLQETTTIG
jgi:hypothetical protein